MQTISSPRPGSHRVGAIVCTALSALALAACSAGPSAGPATPGATGGGPGGPSAGGTRGARVPGVSGLVAAVEGSTMQVQTPTKQTAVTWTPTTVLATVTAGKLGDVMVGSCVSVRTDAAGAEATGAASVGPYAALSVVVTRPAAAAATGAAACLTGGDLRGPGGIPPAGATGRPSRTGDAPSGAPGGPGAGRGGAVVGVVTAVAAQGFTVDGVHVGGFGGPTPNSTPGAGGTPWPTATIEVTASAQTTVTVTRAAAATDVKVGVCASAQGNTDDTGAMTATRIVLTEPVQGSCQGGGFGGFGPGGAGPRPSGATS